MFMLNVPNKFNSPKRN